MSTVYSDALQMLVKGAGTPIDRTPVVQCNESWVRTMYFGLITLMALKCSAYQLSAMRIMCPITYQAVLHDISRALPDREREMRRGEEGRETERGTGGERCGTVEGTKAPHGVLLLRHRCQGRCMQNSCICMWGVVRGREV